MRFYDSVEYGQEAADCYLCGPVQPRLVVSNELVTGWRVIDYFGCERRSSQHFSSAEEVLRFLGACPEETDWHPAALALHASISEHLNRKEAA
jgi:hypothetical protein